MRRDCGEDSNLYILPDFQSQTLVTHSTATTAQLSSAASYMRQFSCRIHTLLLIHILLGKQQCGTWLVSDYFSRVSQNWTLDYQRHLYKKNTGKMCLLVFACLLVYLFICLFIIWKWLYKLFMNMLQIQTNSFCISWGFCWTAGIYLGNMLRARKKKKEKQKRRDWQSTQEVNFKYPQRVKNTDTENQLRPLQWPFRWRDVERGSRFDKRMEEIKDKPASATFQSSAFYYCWRFVTSRCLWYYWNRCSPFVNNFILLKECFETVELRLFFTYSFFSNPLLIHFLLKKKSFFPFFFFF